MAAGKKEPKKKIASLRIQFHPAVTSDLQEAYDYYEEQREGLGEDFLKEVESGIKYVENHAALFQVVIGKTRKYNIAKFPYGIFYVLTNKAIRITAIMHLMRNPKTWRGRR